MGYLKNPDQSGVRKGYIKYRFDLRYGGQRYRKMETCRASAVQAIYKAWEDKIYEEIHQTSEEQHQLFEIIDQYIDDVRQYKSDIYIKAEIRALFRLKEYLECDMLISHFRRRHIAEYISWRRGRVFPARDNSRAKGRVANSTINRDIAVISSLFNWAIKREIYNSVNPASMSKLKEANYREVRLSKDQINTMIDTAYSISDNLGRVVSMALMTGMRKKEILSLEWNEVHFNSSIILLSATKTKSKKARIIPLVGDLRNLLIEIQNGEENCEEYVFAGYTADILRKQWQKLLKQVEFNRIKDGTSLHFHDLRHIYAQALLDQGVGLEDIQSLLGHEDIATTQKRYAMFARPDLHSKAEKISNVIRFKRAV